MVHPCGGIPKAGQQKWDVIGRTFSRLIFFGFFVLGFHVGFLVFYGLFFA